MRNLITSLAVIGALGLGTTSMSLADSVHYEYDDDGHLERKVIIDDNSDVERRVERKIIIDDDNGVERVEQEVIMTDDNGVRRVKRIKRVKRKVLIHDDSDLRLNDDDVRFDMDL